ncbi:MAG: TetR family transcriptional regulator [Deltaproteobacteria bacterium]|nr:MAG: TetR family transcriptional regulator [Deltaproteobacteria bacterium]
MPYAREHKNKTRARIVDSARVLFNRHGFEAVSIDDVMKGAARPRHRHLRLRKERRRGCQAARRQASGARERHHDERRNGPVAPLAARDRRVRGVLVEAQGRPRASAARCRSKLQHG